eukprot:PhF_6_TR30618/c0_g1_i4/m.45089/K01876/DARS, aspS; aspartyl-tRNA synthetase
MMKRVLVRIPSLVSNNTPKTVGQPITVRARVSTIRGKGKINFVVLRENGASIQGVLSATLLKDVRPESIVEVTGTLVKAAKPILSTTISDYELQINEVEMVSQSKEVLPFQIGDVKAGTVGLDTRLNARYFDLRVPSTRTMMLMSHVVCAQFRSYLMAVHNFMEIHSPKLISSASEGAGATVFKVNYFDNVAFLAQSPQLYKQMAVQGDLARGVFEIGPVFRAENANTHRHLTEFTGLDVEMVIDHSYHEILNVLEGLLTSIFTKLGEVAVAEGVAVPPFVAELSPETIAKFGIGKVSQTTASQDEYGAVINGTEDQPKVLRLEFSSGLRMLGLDSSVVDLDTASERKLGQLVKDRYGVDVFVLHKYHTSARPFYTMECPDDNNYTNSFDVIMRGEEICSGSQRIHHADALVARAKRLGVDVTPLSDYIESFRLGAWP